MRRVYSYMNFWFLNKGILIKLHFACIEHHRCIQDCANDCCGLTRFFFVVFKNGNSYIQIEILGLEIVVCYLYLIWGKTEIVQFWANSSWILIWREKKIINEYKSFESIEEKFVRFPFFGDNFSCFQATKNWLTWRVYFCISFSFLHKGILLKLHFSCRLSSVSDENGGMKHLHSSTVMPMVVVNF